MEGTFATAVRTVVGEDVTVAACLDMHANISQELVDALDILTVWRTCPHVDTLARSITTCDACFSSVEWWPFADAL
jgi:microcystin degradation protein MlrC